MRELGVDNAFAATDAGYPFSDYNIHADCEKRLLDIELDLGSSACTFEAVQWAISELQRMELQEGNFGPEDDANEDEHEVLSLEQIKRRNAEGKILLQSGKSDMDSRDAQPEVASWAGSKSGLESFDDKQIKTDDRDASPYGPIVQVEELKKIDVENWRHVSRPPSVKRKSDEDVSGNESEKRPRVRELLSWTKARERVIEADQGKAGHKMAERINSRLAVPGCIFLTNLVGHCLLVSMDQIPTKSIQEAVASLCLNDTDAADSIHEDGSNGGEWMWLHKWLVKTVLSDAGSDGPMASLDWLVAFFTATRQSIIRPILDDLASDLRKREIDGSPTLASYMRRTGILEYAALRDPERTSGSLRALLQPAVFPLQRSKDDDARQHGVDDQLWHGWLGLMVLCPQLFGAFSRLWVPTLSVEVVKSWKLDGVTTFLPAVWTILVDTYVEEPRTKKEWFSAAILRRLPQLAPVASSFIILLSGLDDASTDGGPNEEIRGFGKHLLNSVYKELSMHVLSRVLGDGGDLGKEIHPDVEKWGRDDGLVFFMQNLKLHSYVLWRKALEHYSTSNCTCCKMSRKGAAQLESSGRTGGGSNGSMCIASNEEGCDVKSKHDSRVEDQMGCLFRDPFIQLCHLTLLCCTEHVVADLLARASIIRPCRTDMFESESLRKLLMVMKMMRIVAGQGRGTVILELWAQRVTDHVTIASDEQALMLVLAMRQLLDPTFWQNHHSILGFSSHPELAIPVRKKDEVLTGNRGLSWELVWKLLRTVLDDRWLHILALMHRDEAWDLRLAVLGVLQLLNPEWTTRPQAVAERLKGVLGLFFSWLEISGGYFNRNEIGQTRSPVSTSEQRCRWQGARAREHLKSIVIELASSSFPSFTLMVSNLLDFSFEHSILTSTISSPSSSTNPLSRADLLQRRVGNAGRSSLCVAPLSNGRLDQYGKLVLFSATGSCSDFKMLSGTSQIGDSELTEENSRIQSGTGAITSLQMNERDVVKGISQDRNGIGENVAASTSTGESLRENLIRKSKVRDAELGSLLRQTLERAILQSAECLDAWPCHPVSVLATHLVDRLETPHELPMTMEQYEEVLPKHISSLRHLYLMDCFSRNPLLMEMVELVVKHGDNREVLRCVEFVRVLLADSISRWHNAFRTRWPHSPVVAKVDEEDTWNRMHVNRLIQLVASANWLPQPLAASGEIVAVVDGADIADLLLLVWRCMHHAMAFGSKGWGGSSTPVQSVAGADGQATSTSSSADEEAGKEGTYTEWEAHFFAILRRNVSQIGAHFAQVYPIRKAF